MANCAYLDETPRLIWVFAICKCPLLILFSSPPHLHTMKFKQATPMGFKQQSKVATGIRVTLNRSATQRVIKLKYTHVIYLKTSVHRLGLLHLRNLLTHTLLFWHFLKNLNFELKDYFGIY